MPKANESKAIRELIVLLHKFGLSNKAIAQILSKLKQHICNVISGWKKKGTTKQKTSPGRSRSVRTKQIIKVVRERLRRKPTLKVRKLASNLKISRMSAHRTLKIDLGLKAYR